MVVVEVVERWCPDALGASRAKVAVAVTAAMMMDARV